MPIHQNTNTHIVPFDLIEPSMIAVSQKQAFGLVAEQLDKIGINARILTAKLTESEGTPLHRWGRRCHQAHYD